MKILLSIYSAHITLSQLNAAEF